MVSFEDLREVHRKERASPKLVSIPAGFWRDVSEYFAEKMRRYEELRKNPSRFTDKVLTQFEKEIRNAGRIIKELYTLRERKIIRQAGTEVATGEKQEMQDMVPEERKIYEAVVLNLKAGRDGILAKVLAGRTAGEGGEKKEGAEQTDSRKIRILEPVASFLGTDLNLYGPYEKGQLAELPVKYAELLVEKGKAEPAEE